MKYIESIILLLVLVIAIGMFLTKLKSIRSAIQQGRKENRSENPTARLRNMILVALGQKKMFQRPIPAILHGFIYIGFLVINIEVLGMIIDGLFQTHRVLGVTGIVYDILTISNEVLALFVILVCVILLYRRNIANVKRFRGVEMHAAQKNDANIILYIEIILMLGLFTMNTADLKFYTLQNIELAGVYPISTLLIDFFPNNTASLHMLEKSGWWFHILGILAFLNYLPYSKHFHIMMAFPNTYYYKISPIGKLNAPEHIQQEIKAIMDPSYTIPALPEGSAPLALGAKDIQDLSWKNLLDGFACTECGRCTSVCPANLTGKLLSPRKIIMNIRDRQEDFIQHKEVEKTLLGGYISAEELWACTTCNACVQECPVNIDPVAPIIEMRRFLVMETSAAPASLNAMFANLENNGSPWAFPAADRFNWSSEISYKS